MFFCFGYEVVIGFVFYVRRLCFDVDYIFIVYVKLENICKVCIFEFFGLR